MLEIILFMCLASIAAFMLFVLIAYYNIKRKLRGLPLINGTDTLQEFMKDIKKRQQDKQKKTETKPIKNTTENVDDAEFREVE